MSSSRIPVLMYHRVGTAHNDWEARYAIAPDRFAAHMRILEKNSYRAISIEQLIQWLEGGPDLPDGAFLLTFDDGFLGVHDYAWPILREMGWPFTVFLVAGLIDGQDIWTRASNPSGITYPLLNATQILTMQAEGVSFHSHTLTHASLPTLDDTCLANELSASRTALTEILGSEVFYLAYPYGHVDERVAAAARAAGYRAAFSTQPGFNRRDVNSFRIRRMDVYGTDSAKILLRKIRFGSNDGSIGHVIRYYWHRLASRFHQAAA